MLYENVNPPSLPRFVSNPTHDSFAELLFNNTGESDFLDFKMKWIEFTKLAKHMLAIANSGGGCIIFGVSQTDDGSILLNGLSEEEYMDKADVDNKLERLLPKNLKFRTEDYHFIHNGPPLLKNKRFQSLLIEYDPKYVPYTSVLSKNELRYGAIYVRQGTKTVEATNEKLIEIVLRKVQSGGSGVNDFTLKDHLEQLRELYEELSKQADEEYILFLKELIDQKKIRILQYLDIISTG